MNQRDQLLYQLIVQIRGAFGELGGLSDRVIEDFQITAAMRSVIEHLAETGPQTVPQIAAVKNVSRQHIQVLVAALAERQLIRFQANPGHKRSKLVVLTEAGQHLFTQVRSREAAALAELTLKFENRALFSAVATVTELRAAIREFS